MNLIYVVRAVECPTLAEVVTWLERNGWKFLRHDGPMWDGYATDDAAPVWVPLNEAARDFARRMQETLEEAAARSPDDITTADIYDDIVAHRAHENGAPGAVTERPTGGANEPSR